MDRNAQGQDCERTRRHGLGVCVTSDTEDGARHFLPFTQASLEAQGRLAGVSICFHGEAVVLSVILSAASVGLLDLKQLPARPLR